MSEINADSFARALFHALQEDRIRNSFKAIIMPELTEEIRSLREELRDREEKLCSLQGKLNMLEENYDRLEQYSRRNTICIAGIPEDTDEDAMTMSLDAMNNIIKVSPPVERAEIDRLHRVGQKRTDGKPRQMMIKFVGYQSKKKVMDSKKQLKKVHASDRFPNTLYVNEALTKRRSTIYWHARSHKKEGRLKDTWTMDGSVMIRFHSGSVKQIHSLAQLESEIAAQPPASEQPSNSSG